jgi:predicted glycoside hydrolase/deacetylase ChbG (UPF0249 family)
LSEPAVIVTADDYGYSPAFDRGILEAARAGAVDAVSVMVLREGLEPGHLLATGVEVGLHLELPGWSSEDGRRAGPKDRRAAVAACLEQLERFEVLFERPAAYLDGHHHRHAAPGLAAAVGRLASERGLPVRSVSARHRSLLRCQGVATPDRLLGRVGEGESLLPDELRELARSGVAPPPGITEWMVHPGHADPEAGSAYDRAREEDLKLLLGLRPSRSFRAVRRTHAQALGR